MYGTCNPSLPTVLLPHTGLSCFTAWLCFCSKQPAQPGRLCPNSSTEQAQTPPSQHFMGSYCSHLSWAASVPVPVSPEMGGTSSLLGTPRSSWVQQTQREGGTRFSLSPCAGRSSTGQMCLTGTFGPQQTLKDEFALRPFQSSGTSAASLDREKKILHFFPSRSSCLILLHVLCSTCIKKKKIA